MRAFISAVLAVVLISSVSACRFCWNNSWVNCDAWGNNCAVESSSPAPTATPVIVVPTASAKPTALPTVTPTATPTPVPTATPFSCPAGYTIQVLSTGVSICVAPQSNGGAA